MTDAVGIFGLGLIGKSLLRRLLAGGYDVIGHDPGAAQMAEFTRLGGHAASAQNVWAAPVILAAVFDTDQLASVIAQAPSDTGATLISTSTCDPDRMPALAKQAKAKGLTLIEAPLSGTSKDLADGQAVFLLGGDEEAIAKVSWLWPILGRAWHHLGAIGNGNKAKLAVNLVLGLNRAALAEGLVFAQSIGLPPAGFLPLLTDTAAASAVMASKGPKMVDRDFAPLGRIAQSAKDFQLIEDTAKATGQTLPFTATYLEMMSRCIDNGMADQDNAAIMLAIEMSKTASDA